MDGVWHSHTGLDGIDMEKKDRIRVRAVKKAMKLTKGTGRDAVRIASAARTVGRRAQAGTGKALKRGASAMRKMARQGPGKTALAVKEAASKMREASSALGSSGKRIELKGSQYMKGGAYKCHICGSGSESPIDAVAHLVNHCASALESVSSMIEDQTEGRLTRQDKKGRGAGHEASGPEEEDGEEVGSSNSREGSKGIRS